MSESLTKPLPPHAWKPGQTGNPGGRPLGFKGVAKMIMKSTGGGQEMVDWCLGIWRDVNAPMNFRWDAFMWLSDRGLGRPVSMVELNVTDVRTPRDLSALTEEDLAKIDDVFRSAHGRVIDVP